MRTLLALLCFVTATACATMAPSQLDRPTPVAEPAPDPSTRPTVDRTALRKQLAEARAAQVQRLRDYAAAGAFPKNRVSLAKINVFIDDEGNLCAVANLMAKSGARDLVDRTAAAKNLIVLATVTDGELMDWMLRSGLTQEEIARIQEPYFPYDDPVSWKQEQDRLRAHFAAVLVELDRDAEVSLDLAVDRLAASLS